MRSKALITKIKYYLPAVILLTIFAVGGTFFLTRPVLKMDLLADMSVVDGSYLEHNVFIDSEGLYYVNQEDNHVDVLGDYANFIAKVDLPHLNWGQYKYNIHYVADSEWPCSIWAVGENYDDFYANRTGLYGYKNSTWSYLMVKNTHGTDGVSFYVVAETDGQCIIDSFLLEEYYPWRVGVLLVLLTVIGLILFVWYKVRFWQKKEQLSLLINTVLVIVACLPIILLKMEVLVGDDYAFHISRIASIFQEISYGHFPVFYQSDIGQGQGYLSFVMYGNIFMYVPAFFYAMGLPLSTSLFAYFGIVNVFTVYVAWYSFSRIFSGKNTISLLATSLYVLAPYRMISMYLREAVGEVTAMIFLPLIIYGVYKIYRSDNKLALRDVLPIVVGMSGLINCHILSTEMVVIALAMFAILSITVTIKKWKQWLLAAILTLLVNMFFIWPFIDSYSMDLQCKYEGIRSSLLASALVWQNFIRPFVDVHFASDSVWTSVDEIIVGLPLTLGSMMFVVACVVSGLKKEKINPMLVKTGIIGGVMIFLATRYFPWEWFQGRAGILENAITAIQFPWRYLSIASVILSLITARSVGIIKSAKIRNVLMAVMVLFSVIVTVDFSVKSIEKNEHIVTLSATSALAGDHLYLLANNVEGKTNVKPYATPENSAVVVRRGADKNNAMLFEVTDVIQDSWITVPVVAYDFIVANDLGTGKRLDTEIDQQTGLLNVYVTADYAGIFGVTYQVPKLWKVAYLISAITIMLVAIEYIRRGRV